MHHQLLLGQIKITTGTLIISDLLSMDFFSEEKSKIPQKAYGEIISDETSFFYLNDLQNKTHEVRGVKSDDPYKAWNEISIEFSKEKKQESKKIGYLYLDNSTDFLMSDKDAFKEWKIQSKDKKVDFIFWGRDAYKMAKKLKLQTQNDQQEHCGQYDISSKQAKLLQKEFIKKKWFWQKVVHQIRPHNHQNLLKDVILSSGEKKSGELMLDSLAVLGIGSDSKGDWPIYGDYDEKGHLSRLRIVFEYEEN